MPRISIGLRLRQMRRQRKLSLDVLAAQTGLTKSYLSKLERAIKVPSIASTIKIAKAFGVQVGHLFGETTDQNGVCVVRKDERKPVTRPGTKNGYYYESIVYKRHSKCMEAFIVRSPRQFKDNTFYEHAGEEMIFVLKGRVEVVVADRRTVLGPGDSIYFDGHLLHRSRSLSATQAETLVVVGGV
jgi:transcriptional regulator with XRE-family HTH domain